MRNKKTSPLLERNFWIVFVGILSMAAILLWATSGRCLWCLSDTCFDDSLCGADCECVFIGTNPNGICVGSDGGDDEDEGDWE